jgi:hypothetical protein
MRAGAFVLVRRLLLVISIFLLLVAVPFLIWPQLAAESSSSSSAQSMAGALKDTHRQSASNHRAVNSRWARMTRSFQTLAHGIACG